MAGRIFRSVVLTAILAVLLTAALIVPALYRGYEAQALDGLRLELDCLRQTLDTLEDDVGFLSSLTSESRITLIAGDGTILYDSAADPTQMENHANRPEVVQALAEGIGLSTRWSDTLQETTNYYAEQLRDGGVVRAANTRRSVLGAFMDVLPQAALALLAVAAASVPVAKRSAGCVVAPINALDLDHPLDNDAYDELAPLLSRMDRQQTELHEQLRALRRTRSELTALMQNMREGMVLLDLKSCVLSMNESAAGVFRVSVSTCMGQNFLMVSRDGNLHALTQAALEGRCGDMLLRRGARTWQILASPVLRDGRPKGAVLLMVDETERFAAEASRREFTANVSHELKTPLTSISGYAEIIRDGVALPTDVPAFAGKICSEAKRLLALVNDILELSRMDEGRGLKDRERVPLRLMLESLIEGFAVQTREKNLSVALDAGDARVEGDSMLLRELFFNLLDNAVRYTPEGGSISVRVREDEDGVACAVKDTGVGIPKEHHARVFERFYRVDKSHSRATGGTGLGLAIVKHIAEMHGACLSLESEPGEGTEVTVLFPKN